MALTHAAAGPVPADAAGRTHLDFLVPGARCAGCMGKIERELQALPEVAGARLNLTNRKLSVDFRRPGADAELVVTALARLGYPATAFDPSQAAAQHDAEGRRLILAMAVAAFGAMNAMMFSVPLWAGLFGQELGPATRTVMMLWSGAVGAPCALYAGMPFFRSAWRSLRVGRANMDVPISIGVLLAAAMSLYETATGGEHAYFDASVMLLFFLLIGRFFDARLRRRAYAAANALAALQTASATRIGPLGVAEAVRASDVRPGDVLLIAAGERLAVDAEVMSGASDVDLRMVTGEVEPSAAYTGQVLHAGAVNLSAPLRVRAVAPASQSLTAEIGRLLEAGEQKKSSFRRIADRAAEAYVPQVHIGWTYFCRVARAWCATVAGGLHRHHRAYHHMPVRHRAGRAHGAGRGRRQAVPQWRVPFLRRCAGTHRGG